jgi:hypothetical protein
LKKTAHPGQFWERVRWVIYVAALLGFAGIIWQRVTSGPTLIDESSGKWLFGFLVFTYAMQFVEVTNAKIGDLSHRMELLVKATDTVIGDLRDRVDLLEEELAERPAQSRHDPGQLDS